MRCNQQVYQYIARGYGLRRVKSQCGTTGIEGQLLLCPECEKRMEQEYPQGWMLVPGDICKHGTYVGDAGGPDHICGACEEGL